MVVAAVQAGSSSAPSTLMSVVIRVTGADRVAVWAPGVCSLAWLRQRQASPQPRRRHDP